MKRFSPARALVLTCAITAALVALLMAGTAWASPGSGGDPALNLSVNQPASVLYGANVPVTLVAANPAGQDYGYNLTFRDVLPAGVTYVAGSSTSASAAVPDPTVITNPSTGTETLIWSNLSDLSGGSSYPLSFSVAVNRADYDVGGAAPGTSGNFTTSAQAYVNTDPRYVAKFNADGTPNGPTATSFTGESALVPSTTALSAILIKKSGPATLLRGVHDHQGVYDLTVTDNSVNPTDTVTVDDWLPADLEFLGCGGHNADNTSNADGTNPGSPDEYPGSGPIVVAPVSHCTVPTSVTTLSTTPPGTDGSGNPLPAGVYTHVVWTIGDLTPGQVVTLPYTAAVPIRKNTLNWAANTTGTATTTTAPATTGAQSANLDNNNGAETYNNEPIVNSSQAAGDYQDPADANASIPTSSTSVLSGVAKDIIIAKTVSTPTLAQGQTPTYTLTVSTSEYRFFNNVSVSDTLPNGQCPLDSTRNFEHQAGAECAPVGTRAPSPAYASVAEQVSSGGTGDGTYDMTWDSSTDPALAQIPVNGTVTITFLARTLRYYQQGGADDTSTPVLSGDSITNHAGVSGTAHVRCTGGSNDEDCVTGTTISHDTATSDGTTEASVGTDAASAGQSAPEPTILKEVAAALPADGNCADATYETTLATYGPGDEVCWRLNVHFPQGTDTRVSTLNDFLPTGLTAIAGSAAATSADTVPFTETDSPSAPQLTFTLCPSTSNSADCGPSVGDVGPGGQTFAVTFASTEGAPSGHLSGDVNGNLMKFASVNTAGTTVPQRSSADFQFSVPTLGLVKTVAVVNATNEPSGTTSATITGGATVTYQLAVTNRGTADAQSAVIWDDLPAAETCANVLSASTYSCVAANTSTPAHVVFNPVFVAAGNTSTLRFAVALPVGASEPSPGQTLTDTAGVTSYTSTSNTQAAEKYYPSGDLDPTLGPFSNAPSANASAAVTLANASVTKTAASTVHAVSTSDATVGEPVAYTITSALPGGTTLYGSPTLTDVVPATLALTAGSVSASLDGHTLPDNGVTLTVDHNTITVTFPSGYPVQQSSGDTITITFDATVLDVAANQRTAAIMNTASLTYADSVGAAHTRTGSATTTIVEPNLHITKTDNSAGHLVAPGQTVIFTVTAANPTVTDVSPAYDAAVLDTVPSSVTVLNVSGNPAATGDTVSADGGGGIYNAAARTITWTDIGTLAAGTTKPLRYSATVNANPASGATLVNTATDTASSLPSGTAGDRTSGSGTNTGYTATAADTLTINGPSIVKTATPTSATIGGQVTYTATVTLPANTVFHDLTILDTLPDGLAFDSYGTATPSFKAPVTSLGSAAGPAAGSTNIGWFLGEAGPFTSPQTVTVQYSAHVEATFANGSAVVDTDSLVNSATVQTDQTEKLSSAPTSPPAAASFQNHYGPATAPVKVIEPVIAINKQVIDGTGTPNSHTATANPEDTLTYSVTVTNTGDAPAYAVNVKDTPPASLINVTPVDGASDVRKAWSQSSPTIKWTVPGPIAVGASVTLTYTAVVPDGVTDQELITNTAAVPSYSGLPVDSANARTYTGDPMSVDTVTVNAPVLAITKTPASATATAGSGDSYTVTVTNTGHSSARAVTATDTVPQGMVYTAGTATASADPAFSETSDTAGVITWALGAIPAGSQVAITVPVSFPADTPDPTTLTNHVTAQAPNAANSPSAQSAITVHASADLQAMKSVATAPIPAGGQDTYTLTAKNVGPSDAQSVSLVDVLPASETFVSADAGCTNHAGTVTCMAPTVAAGTSAVFHVTVAISPTVTGPISNTVTVASSTPDPNRANNTATIAPDSISQADVSVTKTADKIQYEGGDTITYTLTAHNAGPASAQGVVITDPLPNVVTFASASAGCTEATGTVTCNAGTIAVGASASFSVKAIANGTAPPAATPGTGDEQLAVTKLEQSVSLTAGETTTVDLSCNSGEISDGDVKVIEVDQGTGTLASVEILKSWATSAHTYEFTLDNTATGSAQAQLNAVCLPSSTTADQNGNTHPLITDAPVTSTETLSQGDHTITVDVGHADVPISPSFAFLNGEGTVQGSEGDSNSSVWTYTIDVSTPTATVEVGSTGLEVQPGAAGGFTNDLEFTSVSQTFTVGANSSANESVICPNGYEGVEATYDLPDGLLLLGDDPEPITRVYSLDNTTGSALTGTLDLLCLADRTGPEVDHLGPVSNTATSSEINVDPNTANNSGTAAIRIDRAVGSGAATPAPAPAPSPTPTPVPAPAGAATGTATASPAGSSSTSSPAGPAKPTPAPVAKLATSQAAPVVQRASAKISATAASVIVTCGAKDACRGLATIVIATTRHGRRVTITVATRRYSVARGHRVRIVLAFRRGVKLTKLQRTHLTLDLKPTGGRLKRVPLTASVRSRLRHRP